MARNIARVLTELARGVYPRRVAPLKALIQVIKGRLIQGAVTVGKATVIKASCHSVVAVRLGAHNVFAVSILTIGIIAMSFFAVIVFALRIVTTNVVAIGLRASCRLVTVHKAVTYRCTPSGAMIPVTARHARPTRSGGSVISQAVTQTVGVETGVRRHRTRVSHVYSFPVGLKKVFTAIIRRREYL